MALVPLRMTQAMRDITDAGEWEWADLLAAANAVTPEEYEAAQAAPAVAAPEPQRAPFTQAQLRRLYDNSPELVGECATLGTESLLTGDEISDFARAVLVHGSALAVALRPTDAETMRELLRCAERVRAWMGDGCNADETPKPHLAALVEWAGTTAAGMLGATTAARTNDTAPGAGEK